MAANAWGVCDQCPPSLCWTWLDPTGDVCPYYSVLCVGQEVNWSPQQSYKPCDPSYTRPPSYWGLCDDRVDRDFCHDPEEIWDGWTADFRIEGLAYRSIPGTGKIVFDNPGEGTVTASVNDLGAPGCKDTGGPWDMVEAPFRVVKVDIKQDGQVITDTTHDEIVGKHINLSAEVPPGLICTYQWVIPGRIIKNYAADNASASVIEVPASDLQQQNVSFYWVDGGDGREVKCTVTIGEHQCIGKATIDVKRPTDVTMTAATGDVDVIGGGGMGTLTYHGPGMSFAGACTIPQGFAGTLKWIQIVDGSRRAYNSADQLWYRADLKGLDTTYPYGAGANVVDTPQMKMGNPYTKFQANDTFTMWLMFEPDGGIPVPLRKMDWWWSGSAHWDGNQYVLTVGDHVQNPSSSDTTSYPLWTKNCLPAPFVRE